MNRLLKKFKNDLVGLLFFASGLFVGLSLLSFRPTDPSFNSIGKGLHVVNLCGYVGSFLADGLYEILGLSAWLLVAGLIRQGVICFQGGAPDFKSLRMVWASVALLTFSALLGLYWPQTRLFQEQIPVGGLIGMGLAQGMTVAFNRIGAQIMLWTGAAVLTIFYSEKSVGELAGYPLAVWDWFNAKWTASRQAAKKAKVRQDIEEKQNRPEPKVKVPSFLTAAVDILETKPPEQTELPLEIEEEESLSPTDAPAKARRKVTMPVRVARRVENWELPKLSLLQDPPATRIRYDEREIKNKAQILSEKLSKFSVTGEVVNALPGPAVTMFEFRPDADVKLNTITALEDDLSLALSSESLRILAPIPGRDVVGVETSNAQRETVYFKDMLGVEEFWKDDMKLPMALGKTSTGEPKIVDLRRMPHLMVAGTTGSGKSVFTVSLITGLLFKHSPKTLKMIIVDPKQVDYAAFEKIPHLAMPVISETRQAVTALKWAVNEMERRYRSMSQFGARGLESYNETVAGLSKAQQEEHEKINQDLDSAPGRKNEKYYFHELPYIVIILEEFGDLMTVDKNNVEHSVVRLAQKARASGIHLVLAMQSPRKEVVTGLIKTNIPGRIAFKVSSSQDSRVILGENGAERLLQQGDMLFMSPGSSSLVRHHGPFLKDSEVVDIAKFWSNQAEPEFDPAIMKTLEGGIDPIDAGIDGETGDQEYDEIYDQVLAWASSQKTVSASLIQRRFQIGYPRAARLVETFEREGVVGPSSGSKPRQVLVNNLASLDE